MSERRPVTPNSLQPLGEALQALVGLAPDWDSYGALPPTTAALERAWQIASTLVDHSLPIPQLFPTRSGGIQLEWHTPNASLEWEIDANPATGVFTFDDRRTGEKLDRELPRDLELLAHALARVLELLAHALARVLVA